MFAACPQAFVDCVVYIADHLGAIEWLWSHLGSSLVADAKKNVAVVVVVKAGCGSWVTFS